ncbi:hypothetical protein [Streptomyces sp. LN699]|uniref:hypothetical protein n=1 Tax=Streptomyces sp. LN699 TaxID=3112981 RepID=UPI003723D8E2
MSRLPLGVVGVLVVGVVLAAAVPAHAAGPGGVVACPPTKLNCDIRADDGKPGQGVGKLAVGKPAACVIDGAEVPCSTPEMGRFSAADSCYWKETTGPTGGLPPGFDTGAPAGWKPGDPGGSLCLVTCPSG